MNILVIAPRHDLATYHSEYLADGLGDEIDRLPDAYVKELRSLSANRWQIRATLKMIPWDFVLYFGHGERDCWKSGFGKLIGIEHAPLFQHKVIYHMACSVGQELAPAMIAAGAIAVIGNAAAVYGALNEAKIHNFAEDFKLVWYSEVMRLMNGETICAAVNDAITDWTALHNFYLDSARQDPTHTKIWNDYAHRAYANALHHSFWGEGSTALANLDPTRYLR